jgi:hypothetical protein
MGRDKSPLSAGAGPGGRGFRYPTQKLDWLTKTEEHRIFAYTETLYLPLIT